jgi:hypothetical protein
MSKRRSCYLCRVNVLEPPHHLVQDELNVLAVQLVRTTPRAVDERTKVAVHHLGHDIHVTRSPVPTRHKHVHHLHQVLVSQLHVCRREAVGWQVSE